jgi:hypothetical protein
MKGCRASENGAMTENAADDHESEEIQPKSRFKEFAEILNPLFWADDFNRADRMLEFVCALVRAAGLEDTGWDSYQESVTLLEDLKRLWSLDLPKETFPEPDNTRMRLYLISYCHVPRLIVCTAIPASFGGWSTSKASTERGIHPRLSSRKLTSRSRLTDGT